MTREEGYYWVKYLGANADSDWIIMGFEDGTWWVDDTRYEEDTLLIGPHIRTPDEINVLGDIDRLIAEVERLRKFLNTFQEEMQVAGAITPILAQHIGETYLGWDKEARRT